MLFIWSVHHVNICNACVLNFKCYYQSGQKKDEDKPPSDDKWNALDKSSWKKASMPVTQTTFLLGEWIEKQDRNACWIYYSFSNSNDFHLNRLNIVGCQNCCHYTSERYAMELVSCTVAHFMVADWEGNKGSMLKLKLLYVIFIDVTMTCILPCSFPSPNPDCVK